MESMVLSVDKALSKLDYSYKLYEIVLCGYADKHGQAHLELRQLSEGGKYTQARTLAHSLKGLCGNLGAERLGAYAAKLEQVFKEERTDHSLLEAFAKEQLMVMEDIQRVLSRLPDGE